jgi:hypothetical protein
VSFIKYGRFNEAKYGGLYGLAIVFGGQELVLEEEGLVEGLLGPVAPIKVEPNKAKPNIVALKGEWVG